MIGMDSAFGRGGAADWWFQRISAILLFIYTVVLVYQLCPIPEMTHASLTAAFAPTWMKAFTVVAVSALAVHAWAGLWIVSTDYLKPKVLRNLFQLIVLITCVALIVWAVRIFWG